jgi:hypothetical protein
MPIAAARWLFATKPAAPITSDFAFTVAFEPGAEDRRSFGLALRLPAPLQSRHRLVSSWSDGKQIHRPLTALVDLLPFATFCDATDGKISPNSRCFITIFLALGCAIFPACFLHTR